MERFRVLVCGGRDYHDKARIGEFLTALSIRVGMFWVIQGGASGADVLAGDWGRENGMPVAIVPAHWSFYNKSAGPIRNNWMLELFPHICVAFPGGKGTADMIKQAKKGNVPVMEVTASGELLLSNEVAHRINEYRMYKQVLESENGKDQVG